MTTKATIIRIGGAEALQQVLDSNAAVLLYFSSASCAVCHALKPKVFAMMAEQFPRFVVGEVALDESAASTELAAQLSVFTVPTVIAWFDGHESLRLSRAFSLGSLIDALQRPYTLRFEP